MNIYELHLCTSLSFISLLAQHFTQSRPKKLTSSHIILLLPITIRRIENWPDFPALPSLAQQAHSLYNNIISDSTFPKKNYIPKILIIWKLKQLYSFFLSYDALGRKKGNDVRRGWSTKNYYCCPTGRLVAHLYFYSLVHYICNSG